jgi:MFS family permease
MASEGSIWRVLRGCIAPVYFPIGAILLGVGILIPVLPLYLTQEDVSLSMVGLVIAGAGLGAFVIGLPAAAVTERFGNDQMTFVAVVIAALGILAFPLSSIAVVLIALRVLAGFGLGAIFQSRSLYVSRNIETQYRGRVSSFIGGTNRLAFVVGPILGGWIVDRWSYDAAFVVSGLTTASALLWVLLPGGREPAEAAPVERVSIGPALRRHRGLLLRGGIGSLLILGAREGRYVVVPLVADQFELSASEIGLVVAIGTGIDFACFPVAGWIMDRFGRLYAIVPFFSLMAVGLVLLGRADSIRDVVVASLVMGLGNGLTSGSMITLATDMAPSDAQGPFIAGMTLMGNSGLFVGPFLVGWLADIAGLDVSAYGLATMLLVGVRWMALVVGETHSDGRQAVGAVKRTTET